MKLKGKCILLISPEPWNHIFVSKHHYAIHLSKRDNRVFFLNPPVSFEALTATKYPNVFIIDYGGFPKGLRFYPGFLQKFFIRKVYRQLEKLAGTSFDVVWSFDNSVFFDFSAFPENVLKISHIVDLNQDFQTQRSAETADICFCVTGQIKNNLARYNKRVFKIQHGYNHVENIRPVSLPGRTDSRKTVYVGNLALPFLDWKCIMGVVNRNKNDDFIFIGPGKNKIFKENNGIQSAENIYFIDRISSDEIPAYLESADILIIFYQEQHRQETANSHKMMEYLGAGKVVVSTLIEEFRQHADIIEMAEQNERFHESYARVIKALDFYNSIGLMEKRKAFALDNTYDKQIDRIESILINEK